MALATLLYVVIAFCGFSSVHMECMPPKGEQKTNTLEWKIMISDVVAHGVVTQVESDPEMSKDTYSVAFEVRCIYKGGAIDEMIRINQVGYNSNNCLTTNLTLGQAYLVYLKSTDSGHFVQEFKPDPAVQHYLDEIVVVCDATVSYPKGYDLNNNKETCPEEYMYEDCLPRPVLANPPYSEDDQSTLAPGGATNLQKEGKDQGHEAPNNPGMVQGNGDNGSATLTLNLIALALLLLVTVILL